jgi:hypothetical protein
MKAALVCWISPVNGIAVIVSQERLDQVQAIHDARTWAEFAAADRTAYQGAIEFFAGADGELPPLDATFDVSMVPGFDEGDYPPWLQSEMDRYVPAAILERHATRRSSVLNGGFWAVEPRALASVIEELRAAGFEVTEKDDVQFG